MKKRWIIAASTYLLAGIIYAASLPTMGYGIATTDNGVLWVTDIYEHQIKQIKDGKIIQAIGQEEGYIDGDIKAARWSAPTDIAIHKEIIWIADSQNHAIRKIQDGKVTTVAGKGKMGYKDGKREEALFAQPTGIAVDKKENIYIADTLNHVIRKIDYLGEVTTIAGTPGEKGYKEGACEKALFDEPTNIYINDDESLYVVDSGNHCIRLIKEGQVKTVAKGFSYPKTIDKMSDGSFIVTDTYKNALKQVKTNGEVVTIQIPEEIENPIGVAVTKEGVYTSQLWKNEIIQVQYPLHVKKEEKNWVEETPYDRNTKEIQVWFEGKRISFIQRSPKILEQQTFLPLREVVQGIEGSIEWDRKKQEVRIKMDEQTICTNTEKMKKIDGVWYVPVRILGEVLNLSVTWVPEHRAVVITRK